MRLRTEKRHGLLDNGAKAICVIKWQKTWLNCIHVIVLYSRLNLQVTKLGV